MPIPYSFCPASSSIFGSCRCLSHPGLLPCSLPDGTLFQPPCLLQGCPASLSLCLHLAPPGQLAGLGLSLMSWGSVPCLPEQDRSPRCPLPGILSAPWYSSMHSPCVAPVREGAGGGGGVPGLLFPCRNGRDLSDGLWFEALTQRQHPREKELWSLSTKGPVLFLLLVRRRL